MEINNEFSLIYFNESNQNNSNNNKLEALAFYSGIHNCSKGEHFNILDTDITEIAKNSNEWLNKRDLPIFTEHNKLSANIKGVVKDENSFVARPIDNTDVERNPKLKNLIGQMGLFIKNIELTDNNLLDNIKKGVGKAVSIGVDLKNKIVHELSLVGLSALPQASIFNKNSNNITYFNLNKSKIKMKNQNNFALTMDEALQESAKSEQARKDAEDLLCVFLDVVEDIQEVSDEELQGQSREDIYNQALNDYMTKLDELVNPMQNMLEVNNSNNNQVLQNNSPVQNNTNSRLNTQYSNSSSYNNFSIPFDIDNFDEMEQYLSEYGLLSTAGSFLAKKANSIGGGLKSAVSGGIKKVAGTKLGGKVLGGAANAIQSGIRKTANLAGNNAGSLGTKVGKSLNTLNKGISSNRQKLGFKTNKKLISFKNKGKLLNS